MLFFNTTQYSLMMNLGKEIPGPHHYGKQHIKIEGKKESKVEHKITIFCSTIINNIGLVVDKLCWIWHNRVE